MSRVTFSNTSTITIDVQARRAWVAPVNGQSGTAEVRLTLTSPACDSAYISATAGSLMSVASESGCGDWNGIVTNVKYTQDEVTVTAHQPTILLSRLPVPLGQTISNTSVSEIVRAAFKAAAGAGGALPLAAGAVAGGPTHLTSFTFNGESVWDVLTRLMALTGYETQVRVYSPSGGGRASPWNENQALPDTLTWNGPSSSPVYDGLLLAPGQFQNAVYDVDILDQIVRATVINSHDSLSLSAPSQAGHWPVQAVIHDTTLTTVARLRTRAQAELARRSPAAVQIAGAVPRAYWSLREGDYVRICMPTALFTGDTFLARVLAREIGMDGDLMTLVLEYLGSGYQKPAGWRLPSQHRDLRVMQRLLSYGRPPGAYKQFPS